MLLILRLVHCWHLVKQLLSKYNKLMRFNAIIARSNVTRKSIYHYSDDCTTEVIFWTHKHTPYLALMGKTLGCFCEYLKEKKSGCFKGPHCMSARKNGLNTQRRKLPQIAKFMGPTWGPPGSSRAQVGPMLAPWTLLSGTLSMRLNTLGERLPMLQLWQDRQG